MSSGQFQEVLPKQGLLYQEDMPNTVLCKPKLLPLKSVTLERLEKMQREAQETVKQQEMEERKQLKDVFGHSDSHADSHSDSHSDAQSSADTLTL